jgi:transposase, IS6 family
VDETYIEVHGDWMYLYRVVDSAGNTLDFVLSPSCDARSAEYFFRKLLGNTHTVAPRVINVDKNAAYPPTFKAMQLDGRIALEYELRPLKYLNNRIEQDHRFMSYAPLARSNAGSSLA